MRCAPENGRGEQGKTTYSLKLGQNVLADTVLVKVIFNRGDNLIYDRTIDTRLIDREWVSFFVLVKHEWH
jgi:hypothetical protein